MFPDFNEVPRARFIQWQGSILGMLTVVIYAAVVMIPVILALDTLKEVINMETALILSEIIALVIIVLSYRIAKKEVSRVYTVEP